MKQKRWAFFRTDAATEAEEKLNGKGGVRSFLGIYQGVRIPWLLYLVTMGLNIAASYVVTQRATYTAQVAAGQLDAHVIIMFALLDICYIIVSFATVSGGIANNQLVSHVRSKLWDKIIYLPTSYYDQESPGRLISRVTNDTDIVTRPFDMVLGMGSMISLVALVVNEMNKLNQTMLFWYVIANLFLFAYTLVIMRLYRKIGHMVNNRLSKLTAFLSERLTNFRLIKSSGAEEAELEEGYQLIDLRYRAALLSTFGGVLNQLNYTLSGCVIIFTSFGIGGILLNKGLISDGSIMLTFYYYGGTLSTCIFMVCNYLTSVSGMFGRANKFASIFKVESEDILSGGALNMPDQDLTFEDVSFRYNQETAVLEHVSCVIPKGKVSAIVGANGTGKSTMMKLIERLYPVGEGRLLFGDVDSAGISLKEWRSMFGMVTQEANLFSGTVRENICYGIERAVSEEELAEVARLAAIEDLINSLPNGFDTEIGTSGGRLSGGERQRLAIARAMMKNPEYLLLDEATANLDTKTEQQVKQGLRQLMKGRTTIMIAHNLSAIREADYIIVMQNGTVLDSGTHEELLARCEYYQSFVSTQISDGTIKEEV